MSIEKLMALACVLVVLGLAGYSTISFGMAIKEKELENGHLLLNVMITHSSNPVSATIYYIPKNGTNVSFINKPLENDQNSIDLGENQGEGRISVKAINTRGIERSLSFDYIPSTELP